MSCCRRQLHTNIAGRQRDKEEEEEEGGGVQIIDGRGVQSLETEDRKREIVGRI